MLNFTKTELVFWHLQECTVKNFDFPKRIIYSFNPRKHHPITQPRKLPEKVHIREIQPVVMGLATLFACVEVLHFFLIEMLGKEGFTVKAFFFQVIQYYA